jgi:hypothetical protein
MPRVRKIIEAEVAPVVEEPKQTQEEAFDLNTVAEMVMVGRLKNGTEFVKLINFDDILKARAYLDYGVKYFDFVLEKAIYDRFKQGQSKEQQQ